MAKIYLLGSNKKNLSPFLQWGFKTVFVNPTIMASMLPIVFVQMNVKNFWQHVYVYSLMEWCVLEPFASSISAAADTHGFWPKNCCRCGGAAFKLRMGRLWRGRENGSWDNLIWAHHPWGFRPSFLVEYDSCKNEINEKGMNGDQKRFAFILFWTLVGGKKRPFIIICTYLCT